MPDAIFDHPRLAAVYDAFDPDRRDLVPYLAMLDETGARTVVDLGCGTGVLALLLADRGVEVTGVDPAGASLAIAAAKPGADRVRWIHGDAAALPPGPVDAVVMTGNAAQAVVDEDDWRHLLHAVRDVLRPGGTFVVETRDPAARGWEEWTPGATAASADVPGIGIVRTSTELELVEPPIVRFRTTIRFEADGAELVSRSTLRFRGRDEMERGLADAGLVTVDVRDAPDRPGREFVFLARRPADPA